MSNNNNNSRVYSSAKNAHIAQTRKETRERRKTLACKTVEVKIVYNRLCKKTNRHVA